MKIDYLMWYMLIGVVLNILHDRLEDDLLKKELLESPMSTYEKLYCLFLWPFALIVFLIAFFKSVSNDKDS